MQEIAKFLYTIKQGSRKWDMLTESSISEILLKVFPVYIIVPR